MSGPSDFLTQGLRDAGFALTIAPARPRGTIAPTALPDGVKTVSLPCVRRFALSGKVQPVVDPDTCVLFCVRCSRWRPRARRTLPCPGFGPYKVLEALDL